MNLNLRSQFEKSTPMVALLSPSQTPLNGRSSAVRVDEIKTQIHQEILALMDWPVSYTHLTLPTICSV